jgi:hypothetical protein
MNRCALNFLSAIGPYGRVGIGTGLAAVFVVGLLFTATPVMLAEWIKKRTKRQ